MNNTKNINHNIKKLIIITMITMRMKDMELNFVYFCLPKTHSYLIASNCL